MPGADAEELRTHLRKFLDQHADRTRLRQQLDRDSGYDPNLWRRAADELGLAGLATPERLGGSDAGLSTLGVVFEELGRALTCAPYLATIGLATSAVRAACGAEVAAPMLAAITSGTVATLAWDGEWPSGSALRLDGTAITGIAPLVLDGNDAELLLVAARVDGGAVGLCRVEPNAAGLLRTPLVTLDTTRRMSRIDFDAVPATMLAEDAGADLDHALDIAALLLAAEQVGGAGRVLEMAVEYAQSRIQFGRPIGSFQAVKHRCADMLVDVELARSLVFHALHAADADPAAAALESALVRGFVSDAYVACAAANIQIHGGIGFTWEHDAHLYLKRAKAAQALFGSSTAARLRAAALLGVST